MSPPLTTEALLEHSSALRRLARSLIGDAAGADDLLQVTMTRALERTPGSPRNLRAWLARVMRNAAHEERRRGRRREDRERVVARVEATASAAELVERFDSRMAVTKAVRRLQEPYREAILLRYFEDLPPRRIAARLGVPVKTIDSRLHRALERLRLELDDEHDGDRVAWCALLLPLARNASLTPLTMGALLMNAKVLASVSIALVCAILYFVWRADPAAAEPALAALTENEAPMPASGASSTGAPAELSSPSETSREERPTPAVEAPPVEDPAPEVEGRAFDVAGRPAAGLVLRWSTSERSDQPEQITTDAQGTFRLPGDEEIALVTCDDERFVSVLDFEGRAWFEPSVAMVVVVAPVSRVAGVVLDSAQQPQPGTSVELELPESFRARVPFDLRSTRTTSWHARTNAEGRFAFEFAPQVEGLTCRARKAGFEDALVQVEPPATETLELILGRPGPVTALEGRVVDGHSEPMAGARVALGLLPATSDADGRFRIEFDPEAPPDRLMVVAQDKLPEVLERGDSDWPPFVEVRLEREPLSISGVVLGADGRSLPGAAVWIDETTVFASWSGGFWVAENTIRRRNELQLRVDADENGRFEIDGLMERDYGLMAMDGPRAWQIEAGSFPAGAQDVEIRFPADGLHPRLEGRVVDSHGLPIADVKVSVQTTMLAARDPSGQEYYNGRTGSETTTDAHGGFVLEDVPLERATLEIQNAHKVFAREVQIPASATELLVIEVARRCELRLERPAGSESASTFSLLDAAGEPLAMLREEVGRRTHLKRAPLADGHSEVLVVPDSGVRIALYDEAGDELRRMDVRLKPGELNFVR